MPLHALPTYEAVILMGVLQARAGSHGFRVMVTRVVIRERGDKYRESGRVYSKQRVAKHYEG